MEKLDGVVQNYDWGKLGSSSEVGSLYAAAGMPLDPKKPYAELWMGTHPNGPSKMKGTSVLLSDWLGQHTSVLGKHTETFLSSKNEKTGEIKLPFLFKVLSVRQALSIQIHPDKEQAKVLHTKDPKNYPDGNHKPEMAIALTEFEMLCGFRDSKEIATFLESVEELRSMINKDLAQQFLAAAHTDDKNQKKIALKMVFSDLMNQSPQVVQDCAKRLAERIGKMDSSPQRQQQQQLPALKLFLRLNKQYPGDVGCFVAFFLNHIILQPGESVFLQAGIAHAYLEGDCMECMACSDNTVRAGLTPKFKDVDTLVALIDYEMKTVKELKYVPTAVDKFTSLFKPIVPDFRLYRINVVEPKVRCLIGKIEYCSIAICIQGKAIEEFEDKKATQAGTAIQRGDIILIPAEISVHLHVVEAPFLLFRAFCDSTSLYST